MPKPDVEIVTGIFESTNERNFAAALDGYADDVELILHVDLGALETTVEGKPAVSEWFGDWFRQFASDYRFEVAEARATGGDRVFLVATHYGKGRSSGAPVEQTTAYVYTLRDGKVVRIEVWAERGPALRAAGLSD